MFLQKTLLVCLATGMAAQAQVPAPLPPARPRAVVVRSAARRGYLGVGVVLRTAEPAGLEVRRVDYDSPAAHAGLKEHDIILEMNGQKADDVEEFIRKVSEVKPGTTIGLSISREGAKQNLTATVQARAMPMVDLPDIASINESVREQLGTTLRSLNISSPRIGFEGESLSEQLAEYFGVKEGVLVRSVTANTPAAKAGIRAGDVITKVSGVTVTSPREISGLARVGRKPIAFTVMRNHKEMTLNVEIARNDRDFSPEREAL